jgi:hypothetical protein
MSPFSRWPMTEQARRQVTVGVLTTLVGVTVIALASAGWSAKLDRTEFQLHAQDIKNWQDQHVQSDTAWRREQREISLEALCAVNPGSRRCR